jgi:hypothetical protein
MSNSTKVLQMTCSRAATAATLVLLWTACSSAVEPVNAE